MKRCNRARSSWSKESSLILRSSSSWPSVIVIVLPAEDKVNFILSRFVDTMKVMVVPSKGGRERLTSPIVISLPSMTAYSIGSFCGTRHKRFAGNAFESWGLRSHYQGLNSNIYDRSCVDDRPTEERKRKRENYMLYIFNEDEQKVRGSVRKWRGTSRMWHVRNNAELQQARTHCPTVITVIEQMFFCSHLWTALGRFCDSILVKPHRNSWGWYKGSTRHHLGCGLDDFPIEGTQCRHFTLLAFTFYSLWLVLCVVGSRLHLHIAIKPCSTRVSRLLLLRRQHFSISW